MASPARVALSVKGWRCFFGFHRWQLRSVCNRQYVGGTKYWEVYEECRRCGEERSYDERNRNVADALQAKVDARRRVDGSIVRAAGEGDT